MRLAYRLPPTYTDGRPLNPQDIQQINLGLRKVTDPPGVYPYWIIDITFEADADGISHEPLSAFGAVPAGSYVAAAQAQLKTGVVSAWSNESAPFSIPLSWWNRLRDWLASLGF